VPVCSSLARTDSPLCDAPLTAVKPAGHPALTLARAACFPYEKTRTHTLTVGALPLRLWRILIGIAPAPRSSAWCVATAHQAIRPCTAAWKTQRHRAM